MADAFLAYLSKAEADFRAALESLARARKVYNTFLAIETGGQILQGAADRPSEPNTPAEQSVNAALPSGPRAALRYGEGEEVGTNSATARPDTAPGDGGGTAVNTLAAQPAAVAADARTFDDIAGPMPEHLRRERAGA